MSQERVLIAGNDDALHARIEQSLCSAGLSDIDHVEDLGQYESQATGVDVVILVGTDLSQVAERARLIPGLAELPLVAVLPYPASEEHVGRLLAAGMDEVLLGVGAELEVRVRGQLRAAREREEAKLGRRKEESLVQILRVLSEGKDPTEAVREALFAVLDVLGFERASVVAVSEGQDHAHVLGATDDPTLSKFVVSVAAYPEIRAVMETQEPVILVNAREHPLMNERHEELRAHNVHSVALFPILWRRRFCGAIFLRSSQDDASRLTKLHLGYARVLSGIFAQYLIGGRVFEGLREQTERVSLSRYEAERRLRAIEQLRDYFDAASDGIVALDAEGRLLFVNRAAEAITGFARDGLLGHELSELIPTDQRDGLSSVLSRVRGGVNLEAFDLELATTSGDPIRVSVSTSTILSEHDAVLLMFRDVTEQRSVEAELRKTKEFLERLIGSTVDAIVASDIRGNIILFNPGAERIYGWPAAELIGKRKVTELYADGVAGQIMRMLRSASYGGTGRLEPIRREIKARSGELVPVNMTASIIYEDGCEVATVGIFSDLRDRIRIEQRLLQAQERLELSEKQAVLAELAGAAAHELNQPLTSVLGYAELLCKKMGADSPYQKAMQKILTEASRMADIVRQIGRITRYETKSYVGSAQILDIERSTAGAARDPKDNGGARDS